MKFSVFSLFIVFLSACLASDEEIKLACISVEKSGASAALEDVGLNSYYAEEIKVFLDLVAKEESRNVLDECVKAVKAMR